MIAQETLDKMLRLGYVIDGNRVTGPEGGFFIYRGQAERILSNIKPEDVPLCLATGRCLGHYVKPGFSFTTISLLTHILEHQLP